LELKGWLAGGLRVGKGFKQRFRPTGIFMRLFRFTIRYDTAFGFFFSWFSSFEMATILSDFFDTRDNGLDDTQGDGGGCNWCVHFEARFALLVYKHSCTA
jgi:hypothetical protein